MNRFLSIVNFLGVAALAVMCAAQWRTNGQVNQQVEDLERTRSEQAAKLTEQSTKLADAEKTIQSDNTEIDGLHDKLTKSDKALKAAQNEITSIQGKLDAEHSQRISELDAHRTAIDQWKAAVTSRDERIKEDGDQVNKARAERDDATNKYNDLVNKYNNVVKELSARTGGH